MVPAAAVARTPVLESHWVPGTALMMDSAFSFGSTGVFKQRTPILDVSIGTGETTSCTRIRQDQGIMVRDRRDKAPDMDSLWFGLVFRIVAGVGQFCGSWLDVIYTNCRFCKSRVPKKGSIRNRITKESRYLGQCYIGPCGT